MRRPDVHPVPIFIARAGAQQVEIAQHAFADRPEQDKLGAIEVIVGDFPDQRAPISEVPASSVARGALSVSVDIPDFGEVAEEESAFAKK